MHLPFILSLAGMKMHLTEHPAAVLWSQPHLPFIALTNGLSAVTILRLSWSWKTGGVLCPPLRLEYFPMALTNNSQTAEQCRILPFNLLSIILGSDFDAVQQLSQTFLVPSLFLFTQAFPTVKILTYLILSLYLFLWGPGLTQFPFWKFYEKGASGDIGLIF